MRNETVATVGGCPVVVMDSISLIAEKDAGAIVISGSHGGPISGAFALKHPPAIVFFNDAGIGKNNAGALSLDILEEAGIPAATISHEAARIGDAMDAWLHGVVSRRNESAARRGIADGQSIRDAVDRFDGGGSH